MGTKFSIFVSMSVAPPLMQPKHHTFALFTKISLYSLLYLWFKKLNFPKINLDI